MKKYILILIALLAVTSAAVFSEASGPGATFSASISNPVTIKCFMDGSIVTNGDGSKQARLNYTMNGSAGAKIDNGVGIVKASSDISTSTVMGPKITVPTTYTMTVNNGTSTSTCSYLATP